MLADTLEHFSSTAVPPFPGIHTTSLMSPDRASAQAMACSRPPEPITIVFIVVIIRRRTRLLQGRHGRFYPLFQARYRFFILGGKYFLVSVPQHKHQRA